MTDRVFLLGAGFSRAISDAMPLMADLGAEVRRRLDEAGRPLPSSLDHFEDDVERWLSYLAEPQPWHRPSDTYRNLATFADVSEAIHHVLGARQAEAVVRDQPAWLPALAHSWTAQAATVITFNYDLLAEAALLAPTDPNHTSSDLYRVPLTPLGLRKAAVLGSNGSLPVALLKLHGSLNWYWSGLDAGPSDPVFDAGMTGGWSPGGLASRLGQDVTDLVADKVPLVVPPTATKSSYYRNDLLRGQWRLAAEALRKADELVVVGYSLPPSDLTVRNLLQTNFRPGRIVAVNRSERAADSCEEIFPGAVDRTYVGHNAIERFVAEREREFQSTCGSDENGER